MFRSACRRLPISIACLRPTVPGLASSPVPLCLPTIVPGSTSSTKPSPAMQAAAAAFSTSSRQREDYVFKPRKQSYYRISPDGSWVPAASGESPPKDQSQPPLHPAKIRLISWNVNVLDTFADERMSAALDHLHDVVVSTGSESAIIIFFQEVGRSSLKQIRDLAWVKQHFNLTDIDYLPSSYATTTLVDRRLCIDSVFRVPWESRFDRDGLFVDIALRNHLHPNSPHETMRLCNTHLESLYDSTQTRRRQVETAKQYFDQDSVSSAILAGDLNAIQPFDRTLHKDTNLKDAYLLIGGRDGTPGKEDTSNGYTWGYHSPQATRKRFGCCRMDKILFTGCLYPTKFKKIGMGVKVAEKHRPMMKRLHWVSDHYGVMCDFALTGDVRLVEQNT